MKKRKPSRRKVIIKAEELWSLDNTLAKYIYPRLEAYKKITYARPGDLTVAQWDAVLSKMLFSFAMIKADDWPSAFDESINKEVQEGLKLFAEYFTALWY